MIPAHSLPVSLSLSAPIHASLRSAIILPSSPSTPRSFLHTISVNITYSFACFSLISLGSSMSISVSLSLSFWHVSGGHSRSNSGSSESSIPNLARSLLLVDQLIDL